MELSGVMYKQTTDHKLLSLMLEDGFQTILAIMYTINRLTTVAKHLPSWSASTSYCLLQSALEDTFFKTNPREWLVKQASLSIRSGNTIHGAG
eukprot:923868-Amphidinium_carterae.2